MSVVPRHPEAVESKLEEKQEQREDVKEADEARADGLLLIRAIIDVLRLG